MKDDNRGGVFSQFLKLTWECEKHQGEVANMVITREEAESRGLACVLCLSGQQGKEESEVKSLKMTLLQIHQSCQTLMGDATTAAFVDHHILLIRGIVRNQFKEFETNLQASVTNYFQNIRELINGKYFLEFYHCLSSILALRSQPGPSTDQRQLQKWTHKLLAFIFGFERLVTEFDEYACISLEDRLLGKNLVKYIRGEVGDIYKDFKEKSQSLKKNWLEEEVLEIFNLSESSTKSFKFSSSLLHSDLKLTDPKTLKMPNLTDNEHTLLSLIEPALGNKKRSIKLKMEGIKGWVAVGIAFRSQVEASSFNFQQASHGTVQISYDGYSWSNDSSVNEQYTSWYFNEGDTITMTVNPPLGQLTFQRGEETNIYTLKFNKEKKQKIYFCVSLNYHGDAVNIVE